MIEARFKTERGPFTLDSAFTCPSGGITVLFGPSGCGKTTLLRAIAGLDRHPGGVLRLDETTWQDAGTFVEPHRRRLGYVFQEASLFPHLSVLRNLEYGYRRVPEKERRISKEEATDLLDIEPLLDRKPASLSGGERQRVAIARALVVSPQLLLMDEPLASLDDDRRYEILPYIESLPSGLGIPVLFVTHSRDEVARLADHLVLMDAGRVTASGPIAEILTRLDLPLARQRDAEAIVEASVAAHDEQFDLTMLDSAAGRFTVVGREATLGKPVRLRIAARDVSLTLERQSGTSILNIFPARVREMVHEGQAQVTVRLDVGDAVILARVTRKSADALGLRPGTQIYAQVKSVALIH